MANNINPKLVRKFASDLEAYSKVCLQIRTKEAKIEPFSMNYEQRLVHEKLKRQYQETGRIRAIVLKARQMGVSTYTAARFFRRLHLFPNQEALVIADELDRGKKLFAMYDRFAHLLPPEIQPMTRYVSKQTQLVFDNPDDKTRAQQPGLGSMITVESSNDTAAGRASTVQMLHASEMAFWNNAADVWVSISQAIPDNESEVIIESTANGVGNFFHQMWLAAEQGENGYLPIFLPWWTHEKYTLPLTDDAKEYVESSLDDIEAAYINDGIEFEGERHRLTLEQIAWRRQTIRDKLAGDERVFRQEYPATPEEAFLVSGNCFFDEDILKKYDNSSRKERYRANLVKVGSGIVMKVSQRGYLRIWNLPGEKQDGDKEPVYVIAADTASGRQVAARDASLTDPNSEKGGRDFSSADVVDVINRRQVAQLHGRMAPEVFAQQLDYLGKFYSAKSASGSRSVSLIAVEKNHSSGETVLRLLQQQYRYPKLYFGREINRRANRVRQVLGWSTTVETRMPMLDGLAAAIREESIGIPNKDTIKEMYTFVRGEDGKPQAQEGAHDDRVISIAIALAVAGSVNLEPPKHFEEATQYQPTGTESPTGLFAY